MRARSSRSRTSRSSRPASRAIIARRLVGLERAVGEPLGIAADRGQRRLQLVADREQEVALGLARGRQLLGHLVERLARARRARSAPRSAAARAARRRRARGSRRRRGGSGARSSGRRRTTARRRAPRPASAASSRSTRNGRHAADVSSRAAAAAGHARDRAVGVELLLAVVGRLAVARPVHVRARAHGEGRPRLRPSRATPPESSVLVV